MVPRIRIKLNLLTPTEGSQAVRPGVRVRTTMSMRHISPGRDALATIFSFKVQLSCKSKENIDIFDLHSLFSLRKKCYRIFYEESHSIDCNTLIVICQ